MKKIFVQQVLIIGMGIVLIFPVQVLATTKPSKNYVKICNVAVSQSFFKGKPTRIKQTSVGNFASPPNGVCAFEWKKSDYRFEVLEKSKIEKLEDEQYSSVFKKMYLYLNDQKTENIPFLSNFSEKHKILDNIADEKKNRIGIIFVEKLESPSIDNNYVGWSLNLTSVVMVSADRIFVASRSFDLSKDPRIKKEMKIAKKRMQDALAQPEFDIKGLPDETDGPITPDDLASYIQNYDSLYESARDSFLVSKKFKSELKKLKLMLTTAQ